MKNTPVNKITHRHPQQSWLTAKTTNLKCNENIFFYKETINIILLVTLVLPPFIFVLL